MRVMSLTHCHGASTVQYKQQGTGAATAVRPNTYVFSGTAWVSHGGFHGVFLPVFSTALLPY